MKRRDALMAVHDDVSLFLYLPRFVEQMFSLASAFFNMTELLVLSLTGA
jgi:hypothetical protein